MRKIIGMREGETVAQYLGKFLLFSAGMVGIWFALMYIANA